MGKPEENMADLLRFKDVLAMDGKDTMGRPLDFDDMHVTNYRPGEDALTNYRAYRRRRVHDVGSDTATYSESMEMDENSVVLEALTTQQRLARKRQFQRIKSKVKLGRERAKRRIASKEKLVKRSRIQARKMLMKKILKDIPKSELSYARRQEVEKRLDKPAMKQRIDRIAKKLFPKVRQAELAKKRGGAK